jgi:hypothetical protein
VVWKLASNDRLTLEDLDAVDVEFAKSLRMIQGTPQESFEASFGFMDFTIQVGMR